MTTDALPDGAAPARLTITLHPNGAMSIEGPIHDKKFCLAMLDNAKDAVRNHGRPNQGIVVPSRDVAVPAANGQPA